MSDFRRVITALAVVALLTGFGVTASAQVTCTASPLTQPALRAEGITELIGNINLSCTAAVGTTSTISQLQVLLGPGAPTVTSKSTESLLLVNNPGVAQQVIVGTPSGSTVSFANVPVSLPAGTTSLVITNVRVNASAISSSGSFAFTPVQALINVVGSTAPGVVVNNTAPVNVGTVQSGLTFSVRNAASSDTSSGLKLQQCNEAKSTANSLTLRFAENFGTAFKKMGSGAAQTDPLAENYTVESGLTAASQAATGTRLRAVFSGIPAGTNVFVGTTNTAATTTATNAAVLVASETFPNSASGPIAIPSTDTIGGVPAVKLTVDSTGSAVAVWEVTASGTDSASLDFPVFFSAGAGAATAAQQGKVAGSFAPTSATFGSSDTAPLPRFVAATATSNVIIFNLCKTSLLFPFVSAANGFDTGIAIANTTADGGTTTPQAGTCALNFFGTGAPSAVTTQSLNGGDVFANVLSSLAPGYQGYIIATCNFQDAHGFAFVQSTVGYTPSTAAMGYLALVLPRLNGNEVLGF